MVSKSFHNLRVGEFEAALDGRAPTSADRRKTVRSEKRLSERELNQQIETARPQMRAALTAMSKALPAMMKGLHDAGRELEKATANMPQPGYPTR